MKTRVAVSWSGGKDSSLALYHVLRDAEIEVAGLLTTVTAGYDRISMHGVRTELLRAQCNALRLPLFEVEIPAACDNADYERAFIAKVADLQLSGINDFVFGDLFLEDVRAYREKLMGRAHANAHFPLWGEPTAELAREFVARGFRAVLVCVDPSQIAPTFCGRDYDYDLLADLPVTCDPCGERGEFHTYVYDGPVFDEPVKFRKGAVVQRGDFYFCDLVSITESLMPSSRQ